MLQEPVAGQLAINEGPPNSIGLVVFTTTPPSLLQQAFQLLPFTPECAPVPLPECSIRPGKCLASARHGCFRISCRLLRSRWAFADHDLKRFRKGRFHRQASTVAHDYALNLSNVSALGYQKHRFYI